MKIQGCKTGSHLFVGAKKDEVGDISQLIEAVPLCVASPADIALE